MKHFHYFSFPTLHVYLHFIFEGNTSNYEMLFPKMMKAIDTLIILELLEIFFQGWSVTC